MRNFQRKRGWRNIMRSKPVLILLGVFVLFFAWSVLGFWNKMQETGRNKKIAEDKVIQLKQQKSKLTGDINSLNTDQGKEKVFRENFGLAKDGEDMIVVVDDQSQPIQLAPTGGFWSLFKNWFK